MIEFKLHNHGDVAKCYSEVCNKTSIKYRDSKYYSYNQY